MKSRRILAALIATTLAGATVAACTTRVDESGIAAEQSGATQEALTVSHSYYFSVPKVVASNTRSRFNDTDYLTAVVLINNQEKGYAQQALGNVSSGQSVSPSVLIGPITVNDGDDVKFVTNIFNGQPGDWNAYASAHHQGVSTFGAAWNEGGDSCSFDPEGDQACNICSGQECCAGALKPVCDLLNVAFSALNPSCDGQVGTASSSFKGSALYGLMRSDCSGAASWSKTITDPGVTSATGCGSNSLYYTTLRVDEVDGNSPPASTCRSGICCECVGPAVCMSRTQCNAACKS